MIKRINLHGEDLYYLSDLIEKYHLSCTYAIKSNIIDKVIHFGDKDYVNKENYIYIDQLAAYETSCYSVTEAIVKTGLTDYTLSSHEALLSTVFTSIEHDGIVFYPRAEVDALAANLHNSLFPVSDFCSIACGESVIYINELYHYAHKQKTELLGRRNPAMSMARMLFPAESLVSIHGNIAVRCSIPIDILLKSCSKVSLANILDNLLSPFKPSMINTIALMRKFYNNKMNASDSPHIYDVAMQYASPLYKAYKHLRKEIYDFTEAELKAEVLGKPWCNNKTVMQFLQFVKENTDNGFGSGLTFVYRAMYQKNARPDIYSYNEWSELYDYLTDLDRHIAKAYEDRVYAQYWAVMAVHLTSLIRISDIISLKSLHFEGERYVRANELIKRPLELHEAVAITDVFRHHLELIPTVKTNQLKHYYPVIEVAPTIAAAMCILEYHRIREDDISLFTIKAADSDRIDDKFDEIPVRFQSTKATKTLATMIHAKAEENGQTNALFLVSAARSHRMHNGFSETTSIYLQESKLEGYPKEIARYVCRRGVFGWLYIAMLKYINKELPSLENATTQVELLKSRIEPEQAERIADFLQNADREQKAVLKQLSKYSRENISSFLMQLGTANTATSLPETYCIFGKSCSKVRTEPTACLHCYSSLKTSYTLELIGKNLSTLLGRMNEITLSNITERQKLTFQIQKLLFILMDAKSWYNKYDPKFLSAYVDLPKIQAALSAIPDYKFIQLEEESHEQKRH